jgi:serine/threonine protein kinase
MSHHPLLTTHPLEGTSLGGFRLIEPLGHGSFATAYLAQQIGTERKAVVKIAHPHMINGHHGEMIRQRFDAEVRAITRIQHPNMVTVYTSGLTPDDIPYIAMEFVHGHTLDVVLQRSAPLPLDTILIVFEQVASVLKSAHSLGVVHRDITPNNIMIQTDAQGQPIARVLDFGLAMLDEKHSNTVGPIGTPRYLAPEQLHGNPTTRSDMFSMGAIIWWALTGHEYLDQAASVFDIFRIYNNNQAPTDPRSILPSASPQLAAIVSGLLQQDPIYRPDAVTFLDQWRALARVMPSTAELFARRPASSGEWTRPSSQPRTPAPRVTTYTGLSIGAEPSTSHIAASLPKHEQILGGMEVLHVCTEPHHALKVETHAEQLGGFVTRVESFEQLLTTLIQLRPDIVLLDTPTILPHIKTIQHLIHGLPTPTALLYIGEELPDSLPAEVPCILRSELTMRLAPHLRQALNSPLRRLIAKLAGDPHLEIHALTARLASEPGALVSQINTFIGDTPELLAQIEEALNLRDLALVQGLNNALYNNSTRLGLSALSHTLATLATNLQPHKLEDAHSILTRAEEQYMAAFPVILKLRSSIQELI